MTLLPGWSGQAAYARSLQNRNNQILADSGGQQTTNSFAASTTPFSFSKSAPHTSAAALAVGPGDFTAEPTPIPGAGGGQPWNDPRTGTVPLPPSMRPTGAYIPPLDMGHGTDIRDFGGMGYGTTPVAGYTGTPTVYATDWRYDRDLGWIPHAQPAGGGGGGGQRGGDFGFADSSFDRGGGGWISQYLRMMSAH